MAKVYKVNWVDGSGLQSLECDTRREAVEVARSVGRRIGCRQVTVHMISTTDKWVTSSRTEIPCSR